MKALVSMLFCCLHSCVALAQWVDAEFPIPPPARIEEVVSVGTSLYCGGQIRIEEAVDSIYNVVMVREGSQWDTLGRFDNKVHAIAKYGDTLLFAGSFTHVDGVLRQHIVGRVGAQWIPYGEFDQVVHNLRMLGNELYAVGSFQTCDQQVAKGIAKRTGGQWQSMPSLGFIYDPSIWDVELYDGEVYIGGSVSLATTHGIARLVNGAWVDVGPGILGSLSQPRCLKSFQGKLYVSGSIDIGAGNPGHAIMAWNGSSFEALNTGPQFINGSYQYLYRVNTMLEVPGGLLVGGGFNFVDGQPASRMALWDGTNWCGLGGTIGGEVYSIANHNDTLYVSATDDPTFNGVDMNGLAWYQFPISQLNCSFLGVEQESMPTDFGLYPNPTEGVFSIAGSPSPVLHVRVCDLLGRTVVDQTMPCAQGECWISLVGAPCGVYSVTVLEAYGWRTVGTLIKE